MRVFAVDRPAGRDTRGPRSRSGKASFALVIMGQIATLAAAAVIAIGAQRIPFSPAPAAFDLTADWRARREEAIDRLSVRPDDTGARLRLAHVLICQAVSEAQTSIPQAVPPDPDEDGYEYHARLNFALEKDPKIAEARAIARQIAVSRGDRRLRAGAWSALGSLAALEGDADTRAHCLRATWKVYPCADTRSVLPSTSR